MADYTNVRTRFSQGIIIKTFICAEGWVHLWSLTKNRSQMRDSTLKAHGASSSD